MGQRLEKLLDAFSPRRLVEEAKAINAEGRVAEPLYDHPTGQLCVRPLSLYNLDRISGEYPKHQNGCVAPLSDQSEAHLAQIAARVRREVAIPETVDAELWQAVLLGAVGSLGVTKLLLSKKELQENKLRALPANLESVTQKLVVQDQIGCVEKVREDQVLDIRQQADAVLAQLRSSDHAVIDINVGSADFAAQVAACQTEPQILVDAYRQDLEDYVQRHDPEAFGVAAAFLIAAGYLLNRYQTRDVRAQRRIRKMNEALIEEAISAHASDTATPAPEVG